MITRTFKLCLNAGTGSAPYINVSQYDEGETWLFELYSETGERYIPTTGAIVGVKSDGNGIVNTGTVDSEGRVVITETQQMTASAGRAIFELSIDGLTHGTANFIVAVERKPTDDAVMSDSDLSLIQEAIDSAEVIVEVIGDSDPSEVIGEHVDDWLDNHPEATTTVLDGAITAPKINNSLWDKILVNEEASGNPASFDDGADDVPVKSLKVALEPVQLGSGDPSPTNIRPIYPANGKNLIPSATAVENTVNGITYKTTGNGIYYIDGTATAQTRCDFFISGTSSLLAGYKLSFFNTFTGVNLYFRLGGTDKAYWGLSSINRTATIAAADAVEFDQLRLIIPNGTTIHGSFALMMYDGDIHTNYTPYQGITVERTGKNLLQLTATSQTINGVTFTVNADGTILANGTASANISFFIANPTFVADNPSDTYFMSGCPIGGSTTTYRMSVVGATGSDVGNGVSVAYSGTITDTRVRIVIVSGTVCNNLVFKPMIRRADVADDTFEPYTGTSYPYTLGQNVYGGSVDLATGVLTLTKGFKIYDGTETWGTENTYNFYSGTGRGTGVQDNGYLCSHLHFTGILANSTDTSKMPSAYISASGNFNVQRADIEHTGAAMQQWCLEQYQAGTPLTVVYALVTPQTIQLTPTQVKTLLGYNNISSSGTVDVIYHADTKLYVDKMTAVDNNIIAPTEEGFTATRNYTVNDLVIVNDTLYKVTANIATGSAITPNSNVTQTTLSALIKALS